MNCNDFEVIAGDLSKDVLMDANLREKGLEHSASCADCAARLEEERVLTGGLRLLAKASTEEAPANVEAAVLAAFRQNQIVPSTRTSYRRWIYVAASAAALVLIATLIALNASRTQKPELPSSQATTEEKTPGGTVAQSAVPVPRQSERNTVAAKSTMHRTEHGGAISQKPMQVETDSNAITEIATDFIPLTNREALAQMDGGQVMRVELPRSALMSFGLPMDMERATERIKADVVVGNDGLARAIRFVR
ncbi:MAG TPA: hypothetical protein VKN18_28600 [Blastocatellia bacterium]|nr:hypothetical protein [Blastocatellia bacterium]